MTSTSESFVIRLVYHAAQQIYYMYKYDHICVTILHISMNSQVPLQLEKSQTYFNKVMMILIIIDDISLLKPDFRN